MTKIVTESAATVETDHERFTRILLRPQFKPLKDVLDNLGAAVPVLHGAIVATNCYQMFLGKVGYRIEVVKQIHENDCYGRLGRATRCSPSSMTSFVGKYNDAGAYFRPAWPNSIGFSF